LGSACTKAFSLILASRILPSKWAASGAASTESGYRANINDLRDLDESLYQGLLKLKNYPGNVEDFSWISPSPTLYLYLEHRLRPSRERLCREEQILRSTIRIDFFTWLMSHDTIDRTAQNQTQAFMKGLGQIINPKWLSMFNQSELQTLIGGDASEIDVEDLRRNTQYGGVYQIGDDGLEHPTVRMFWRVLKELDDADRRKVLKYVTSTPRAPLLGSLNSIRDSVSGMLAVTRSGCRARALA